MYARGMTTREIRDHVAELYGVTVSAELISKVTDAVLDEVAEWQSRPLEEVHAIVYLDAVIARLAVPARRRRRRVDARLREGSSFRVLGSGARFMSAASSGSPRGAALINSPTRASGGGEAVGVQAPADSPPPGPGLTAARGTAAGAGLRNRHEHDARVRRPLVMLHHQARRDFRRKAADPPVGAVLEAHDLGP